MPAPKAVLTSRKAATFQLTPACRLPTKLLLARDSDITELLSRGDFSPHLGTLVPLAWCPVFNKLELRCELEAFPVINLYRVLRSAGDMLATTISWR